MVLPRQKRMAEIQTDQLRGRCVYMPPRLERDVGGGSRGWTQVVAHLAC